MEQEMKQQASVQLPTTIEQSPEDQPKENHVIQVPPLDCSEPSSIEQKMVQQASAQLPTIIEQSPEDQTKEDHVFELPELDCLDLMYKQDHVIGRPLPNLPCLDLLQEGNRENYIELGIPLYEASITADWKKAKEILDKKPDLIRYGITENGETALHVAASARRTKWVAEFVQNLVDKMEIRDLELQNKSYNTALCLAAATGDLEMVDIMVEKNKALPSIPGSQGMMPLCMASLFGEHDVAKYLYKKSKRLHDDGWNATNRAWLLQKCVEGDMFDIALEIVEEYPELASSNGDVLRILAKKPEVFDRKSSNFLWRTVKFVLSFVGPMVEHPKKDIQALKLLRIIWKDNIAKKPKKEIDDMIRGPCDVIKKDDRLPYGKDDQQLHLLKLIADHVIKIPTEIQKINRRPFANISRRRSMTNAKKTYSSHTLFIAAEMGNSVFIVELIRQYPDLIWKVNDNNQSIFHIAVKHRRQDIYSLLYEIGSMKNLITPLLDENDNNMLHLVGKIAKRERLQDVSGVAFQMQRELLWFREIESMIPPSYRERKNKDGLTPYELFTKEHRELLAKGEEWMKETASQCMVVAALIATIVFAAAFTVPGGYNQTDGIPIFKSKVTFMIFVVANAISLFSSVASLILMFVSFMARYAERDFLKSLPKTFMLGLATLFLSITTMTIAFSFSFFVLYYNHLRWVPILISLFGVVPVFLFVWLICPLLVDVYRSTYGSRCLFRPKKHILYYASHEYKSFFTRT